VPTGQLVRFAICLTAFTFLAARQAAAQQPFVVDDAEIVPRGAWQVEANFEWDDVRPALHPTLHQSVFDVEVGYGVLPRLEVSAIVPMVSLRLDTATGTRSTSGIGDSAIGVKYRLTRNPDAANAFAVSLGVEVPTGSVGRGLGPA
jgi:hypothetical protein